jgi:hypothetical protein
VHASRMENRPSVMHALLSPGRVSTASDFHIHPGPTFGMEFSNPSLSTGNSTSWPASGSASSHPTAETPEPKKTARYSNESGDSSQSPRCLLSNLTQFNRDPHTATPPTFPPTFPPPCPLLLTAPQTFFLPAVAALIFGCAAPRPTAPSIDASSLLLALQASGASPHPRILAPSMLSLPLLHR